MGRHHVRRSRVRPTPSTCRSRMNKDSPSTIAIQQSGNEVGRSRCPRFDVLKSRSASFGGTAPERGESAPRLPQASGSPLFDVDMHRFSHLLDSALRTACGRRSARGKRGCTKIPVGGRCRSSRAPPGSKRVFLRPRRDVIRHPTAIAT